MKRCEHVLLGEADGAEHLMRDGRAFGRGFGAADFGGGGFEEQRVVDAPCAIASAAEPETASAAATSPASRARFCCTAWNLPIGRSKATRSLA